MGEMFDLMELSLDKRQVSPGDNVIIVLPMYKLFEFF